MESDFKLQQQDIKYIQEDIKDIKISIKEISNEFKLLGRVFVRQDVHEEKDAKFETRLAKVESSTVWLFRTVAVIVLTVLLSGLITLI